MLRLFLLEVFYCISFEEGVTSFFMLSSVFIIIGLIIVSVN